MGAEIQTTDLRALAQGSDRTEDIQVLDESDLDAQGNPNPKDLTGAVAKFIATSRPGQPITKEEIRLTSYDVDEVQPIDLSLGKWAVHFVRALTLLLEPAILCWRFVVTERGASKTAAGTLAVVAGSAVGGLITLTGTGVDFSTVEIGDILITTGAPPENAKTVTIEAVDATAKTLQTDYLKWTSEDPISFEIFEGTTEPPRFLTGDLPIIRGG